MWSAIIGAIVAIAGTIITTSVQNNENEKNAKEAQGIANQNRIDTIKQNKVNNQFNLNSLNLQNEQLIHQTNMFEQQKKQKDLEIKDQLDTANQNALTQSASKVLGQENANDSWLFKRNLLNRIK